MQSALETNPVKNNELLLLNWLLLILNNKKPYKKHENFCYFGITVTDFDRLPKNEESWSEIFGNYTVNLNKLGIKIKNTFDVRNEHPEPYLDIEKYGMFAEDYFNLAEIKEKDFNTLNSKILIARKKVLGLKKNTNLNEYEIDISKLSVFNINDEKNRLSFNISDIEGDILKETFKKSKNGESLSWDELSEINFDEVNKKVFEDGCRRINKKFKNHFDEEINLITCKKGESSFNLNLKSE